MDPLDEEIADLEAEIAGYLADLKKDITPAEKSEVRGLINTARLLLIELEKRKTAAIATAGISS
jgi:phage host-nuclease inhibitor protein Gam